MCDLEHPGRSCVGGHGSPFTLLMSRELTDEELSLLNLDQSYNYLTGEFDPYIIMLVVGNALPDIEFELTFAAA